MARINGALILPDYLYRELEYGNRMKRAYEALDVHPDPAAIDDVELELAIREQTRRDLTPEFNLVFDLDGKTIGRFFYEDKQLKFEGDVDESTQVWIDFVIKKFMQWHEENMG